MSKTKNFFYRVNPETVLSELTTVTTDKWLQFFLDFFHDLRNDDLESAKTEIAKQIIKESNNFRELRSKAGKTSAEQKANKSQHMLNMCLTEGQQTSTNSSSSSSTVTEPIKEKVKRFVSPSLQEVETYIKENSYSVDAEKWINHYTANGWKVGKNSMKDWKAAVRTWNNPTVKTAEKELTHQEKLERAFRNSL